MKKIVEYLPLFSVCLIYFGFCNLHGFYKEFMIDIYQYITTTEIIMAFFPTIVFLSGLLSTMLIQEFVGKQPIIVQNEQTAETSEPPSKAIRIIKWLFESFLTWLIIIAGVQIGIRLLLIKYFDFKLYDFQVFNIFAFAIEVIAVLAYLKHTGKQELLRNRPVVIALSLVCFTGMQITTYRKLDAEKIKDGIPIREISFSYHNKLVTTTKQLMYIGQTTEHIFLYDRKGIKTFIYKVDEADSIIIKK